jgi:broad specificity phosphatase PhoE
MTQQYHVQFHARHGAHQDNVLTPQGMEEVKRAAEWVAMEMESRFINVIQIVSSALGRAKQTKSIYEEIFHQHGMAVISYDNDPMFNPAGGITAIQEQGICPKYGQGLIKAWWKLGLEGKTPKDAESFQTVGRRCAEAATNYAITSGKKSALVMVYHGGSIEAAVYALNGVLIPDLPSAGVVEVRVGINTFDPNAIPAPGCTGQPGCTCPAHR